MKPVLLGSLFLISFTILISDALIVSHSCGERWSSCPRRRTGTIVSMAAVPPSDSATLGVVGRGYISVLVAKLSALAGYKTWMIHPTDQKETILKLLGDSDMANLEFIDSSDMDAWQSRLGSTDALIFAVDADVPIDLNTVQYMVNKDLCPDLKRVVTMSRNLNGNGLGFFTKASKISANAEVWDGGTSQQYRKFESALQDACKGCGAEYTIVRAGTLKGGARGADEEPFEQYLAKHFYEMNKKDIVNWQLLFDCNTRGVSLEKGDVMKGPGNKAIFCATSSDAVEGDTSRCGLAEAMVRSLAVESAGNADFGIGTVASRTPPTDGEWDKLFSVL